MGAGSHTINNCALEYLAVWEGGHTHSYGAVTKAPTCTEQGYTTYTCDCGESYVDAYVDALGHTWADSSAVIKECTLCGQVEGGYRIDVEAQEVWIDGAKYSAREDSKGKFVQLEDTDAAVLTVYSYNDAGAEDPHTQYPTGMQGWLLSFTDGAYTAEHVPEFDNLLQYGGSSIRVTGIKGIRMITGIDKALRNALLDGTLGYTLLEYGTCVAWTAALEDAPLVLEEEQTLWNCAYRQGEADPIFADTGDTIQYTNVLVGFTDDQLGQNLTLRPYMILEDGEGEQITIYGGCIVRSIGYIAKQNQDAFAEGTKADAYIEDIISKVYG